ncbi:MAG: NRDE family protein [Candidatus Pacebacteria bacterium]|nr:NRDE family protein [Candidatus Paceibacterota bacterium]
MCLLVVNLYESAHTPVVLAANRDEYYDRPSEPPQLLNTAPQVVGGRDVRGGGTWLGVNECGLIVGLTNRRSEAKVCAHCPSRGVLCAMALRHASAAEAVGHLISHASHTRYNPFTLLAVDVHQAWAVTNTPEWSAIRLTPGWHILGNLSLDDPHDPRVQRARELLPSVRCGEISEIIVSLKALCRDHGDETGGGTQETLCMHGTNAGTRSASITVLAPAGRMHTFLHADGHPCASDFQPVDIPWQKRSAKS